MNVIFITLSQDTILSKGGAFVNENGSIICRKNPYGFGNYVLIGKVLFYTERIYAFNGQNNKSQIATAQNNLLSAMRNKQIVCDLADIDITLKGIEYPQDNHKMKKVCEFSKGVKDIAPCI